MGNYESKPESNMVWAILSTLFCCLPLGIVAIINASKVDGLYHAGNYEAAKEASEKAKNYSLYGAVIMGVFCVLYFLLIVCAGAMAS